MYDKPMCFHLFEFNSGFSGPDNVNKDAVDSDVMYTDVDSSEFAQQLTRVVLIVFLLMWQYTISDMLTKVKRVSYEFVPLFL